MRKEARPEGRDELRYKGQEKRGLFSIWIVPNIQEQGGGLRVKAKVLEDI